MITKLRLIAQLLVAAGLVLIVAGIVLGSTERVIIERYSWEAERSFVIQPDSYAAIRFNGTRTYTYWRSLWQLEVRSTWNWDHSCKWNVTIRSGHILDYGRLFNERAFKGWVDHEPEYASIKFWPTGGFRAGDTPGCGFRFWVEDPGNPYMVLLNNGTAPAIVEASVGERWLQFKNQNVQDGLSLVTVGIAVSIAGAVSWVWRKEKQS